MERVAELIDLMTLKEASGLSEQMRELAVLEKEKQSRLEQQLAPSSKMADFGAFVTSRVQAPAEASLVDLGEPEDALASQMGLKQIISDAGAEFEREWQSALGGLAAQDALHSQEFDFLGQLGGGKAAEEQQEFVFEAKTGPEASAGGKKVSAGLNLFVGLISDFDGLFVWKDLSAWYDLFAELDPLKNPDDIGQKDGIANEQRNC